MKVALVLLALGVCIASCAGSIFDKNCWLHEDACGDDECCVRLTNFVGVCKKLKREGEKCGMKVLKQPFKDHVHLVQCPCIEGTTCVKKEGLVGKLIGTCQAGSEEVTDTNVTEEKVTEEKVTEENVTEEKVTEENVTDEQVTEENVTEENVTEENVTEENVAEK